MNNDDHLTRAFQNLRFADEPPMASTTADDIHRGQRGLRRRRVTTLASGVAMLAVVATGVAIALPGANGDQRADVANGPTANPDDDTEPLIPEELQFPKTTQHLLDTARRHFSDDIPDTPELLFTYGTQHGSTDQSYGGTGGGIVGVTLSVPGPREEWGLVEISQLTPDFADRYFASQPWREFPHDWIEDTIPGTDTGVWVADETQWDLDTAENMAFAIAYEQADGSMVLVDVYQGSGIDIEQAYDLVTDADLQIDPAEATDEYWRLVAGKHASLSGERPATEADE